MAKKPFKTAAYRLIEHFYGDKKAARSGVPLINHIDEGITVLLELGSCHHTRAAYCIHPMLQDDGNIANLPRKLTSCVLSTKTLILAMEYRSVANGYLLTHHRDPNCSIGRPEDINLGPLPEVREMLIADKVQNLKDFETYHSSTHEARDALESYFGWWMDRLEIDESIYQGFCDKIDAEKNRVPERLT